MTAEIQCLHIQQDKQNPSILENKIKPGAANTEKLPVLPGEITVELISQTLRNVKRRKSLNSQESSKSIVCTFYS